MSWIVPPEPYKFTVPLNQTSSSFEWDEFLCAQLMPDKSCWDKAAIPRWAWYVGQLVLKQDAKQLVFKFIKDRPMLQAAIEDDPRTAFTLMTQTSEFKGCIILAA